MTIKNKTRFALGMAAAASIALMTGCTSAEGGQHPYTSMSAHDLAEHLIFEQGGFRLDQETQEGGTVRDRQTQDELQRLCTVTGGGKPDAATLAQVREMANATITYPEGGIQLGDWRNGRELAWSGFGFRVGHNVDDHTTRAPGGNCYNCHQMATDRTGGNLGPSLVGYGKMRGSGEAIKKYVYDMIYNPHAYFACTDMPRFGAKGLLSQDQIADIMAYLFDPASPVNQ